jgi:hypothetical protein
MTVAEIFVYLKVFKVKRILYVPVYLICTMSLSWSISSGILFRHQNLCSYLILQSLLGTTSPTFLSVDTYKVFTEWINVWRQKHLVAWQWAIFFFFIWRIRTFSLFSFRIHPKLWILQRVARTPWTDHLRRKAATYTGQNNNRKMQTYIHAVSEIRTHDPSVRKGAEWLFFLGYK